MDFIDVNELPTPDAWSVVLADINRGEGTEKWDRRMLGLARVIASFSKDPSTQVGAVIATVRKEILSMGFNGFPRGMEDKPEWYSNREEKYSRIIHGEINALIFARQSVEGCTLYTYPFAPCDRCCVQMLQAGIAHFVFPTLSESARERWESAIDKAKEYMGDCHITWTEVVLTDS